MAVIAKSETQRLRSNQPTKPTAVEHDASVVQSLKAIAQKKAERYAQPYSQAAELTVTVLPAMMSVKKTDELTAPYRGEIPGFATLAVPDSATPAIFDITWQYLFRDAKWESDKIQVRAKNNIAARTGLREIVEMDVVMWNAK